MRFGLILPNNWGLDDVADIVDLAVEAEELGLDSVWVNHHIINAGYIADRLGDKPYYDALTVLAAVAARTERITIGTSVLVMPYLHPMATAKALATIDQLSGGRLVAGLGVGMLPEENQVLGVDYDGRGARGDEFIDVMRALWAPGPAVHDGPRWPMHDVVAAPKPVGDSIPIWIGGGGAPARRRAARVGDGWHPMIPVDALAARAPELRDLVAAQGRDPDSIVVAPRVDMTEVPDAVAVDAWRAAGAAELIVSGSGHDISDHRAALHHVVGLI